MIVLMVGKKHIKQLGDWFRQSWTVGCVCGYLCRLATPTDTKEEHKITGRALERKEEVWSRLLPEKCRRYKVLEIEK